MSGPATGIHKTEQGIMGKLSNSKPKNVNGMKDWPLGERPRERLLKEGPECLSDAHLLAVVLRTGSRENSAVDLCRLVLKKTGGIDQLGQLEIAELSAIHGIGPAKAAQLKALYELSRRIHAYSHRPKKPVLSSEDLFKRYAPYYKNKKKEIFKSVLLDGKHRILKDYVISQGSLNLSVVHPREAFNPAIRESAAAIIFLHNHPSGDPTPSQQDIETTHRLVKVGEITGIKVLDHIILGEGSYISMNDRGLLK